MDTSEEPEEPKPGTCSPDAYTPPISPSKLQEVIASIQRKSDQTCPSSSKDTARLDVQVTVTQDRKRKLKDDDDFDDTPWGRTSDFNENWLKIMRRAQSNLLPIDLIEKNKNWITYIPNRNEKLSR